MKRGNSHILKDTAQILICGVCTENVECSGKTFYSAAVWRCKAGPGQYEFALLNSVSACFRHFIFYLMDRPETVAFY